MSSGEEQITYGTWKKVTELLVNTVEEPTKKTEQKKFKERDKTSHTHFLFHSIVFGIYHRDLVE